MPTTLTNGRRTATSYPNGVTQTIAYDASGRKTRTTAKNGSGATLVDFTYTYTKTGTTTDTDLVHTATDGPGSLSYTYDAKDRLTAASSYGSSYSYQYDDNGNRTTEPISGDTSGRPFRTDYKYLWDSTNLLVGTTEYPDERWPTWTISRVNHHDWNGNQTYSSTSGNIYAYNAKGQTMATAPTMPDSEVSGIPGPYWSVPGVPTSGKTMTYAGTDSTERTQSGPTKFTDGFLGLSVAGDPLTFYTRDSEGQLVSQRHAGGNNYYLFDGMGSVVAVTDGLGGVVASYAYDPYGYPISTPSWRLPVPQSPKDTNPWRFVSGYYESSPTGGYAASGLDRPLGLYKFGTRYYDPRVGRWTQPDPVQGTITARGTLNPYIYALDNPVNVVDPDGRFALPGGGNSYYLGCMGACIWDGCEKCRYLSSIPWKTARAAAIAGCLAWHCRAVINACREQCGGGASGFVPSRGMGPAPSGSRSDGVSGGLHEPGECP